MKTYICPRCGYKSSQRTDIKRHFMRKTKCQVTLENISIEDCFQQVLNEELSIVSKSISPTEKKVSNSITEVSQKYHFREKKEEPEENLIDDEKVIVTDTFICKNCDKTFSKKNNLYRHIKHFCKKKTEVDKNIIEEKELEIEKLKRENEILKTTKITNIQNNITNNNNLIINAFGKENLEYIKKEYVQKLVKEGPYASIQKLIKYIHFNPNHKENHNVKIPNKRGKFGMVFDGQQWLLQNKQNMISDLANHAFDIISDHCHDLNSKKFDKFKNDYEGDEPDCLKRISADTELIILNGQKEFGLV